MERLWNGYILEVPEGAFPLGTDSMLLAGFVRTGPQCRILDLGAGCGTLGVLLCAHDPNCTVTGVEIDEIAHRAALSNIIRNDLSLRLFSILGDLRDAQCVPEPGSYHICVSNPPYFSAGPQSKTHPTARREDLCSPEDLFCAASRALRYGGDFYLVHRPEKLAQLCACGAANQLELKRLCLVRHRSDGPVSLLLMQFRKGGKPGLLWEECSLQDEAGAPTEFYRQLYHL